MNCPHCQGKLPDPHGRPGPKRYRINAHHGHIELDQGQMCRLIENAEAYLCGKRELDQALGAARLYREVAERLEYDKDFARHVFAYDGADGSRLFPGATRAAKVAELRERFASRRAQDGDLLRYLELTWPRCWAAEGRSK